jgi:ribosomal protein L37AE/L43A
MQPREVDPGLVQHSTGLLLPQGYDQVVDAVVQDLSIRAARALPTIGCPICPAANVPQRKDGSWQCPSCGSTGGQFKGGRLYCTSHPDTADARLASVRLASGG